MGIVHRVAGHTHPWLADLQAGRIDEATFWARVEAAGTPLVEPDPNMPGHSLVTHLWRTNDAERWVVLSLVAGAPAANLLERVHGTQVCHAAYRYRNDTRMAYSFAPEMPLFDWDAADTAQLRALNDYPKAHPPKHDPLHRENYSYRGEPGKPDTVISVLSMPDAPDESLMHKRDGIPRGELHASTFTSPMLGNERSIWVYTPPGYDPHGPAYPLLVAFDGGMYITQIPAHRMLDNLQADGRITPTVALFINNASPAARNVDLPCSEAFAHCLEHELLPWLGANFNVTQAASQRHVAGLSYGGLAAMWMGYRLPHVFGNVIAQAPSLWWGPGHDVDDPRNTGHYRGEWLVDAFEASPTLPLRIWMEIGLMEHPLLMLASNRRMKGILEAKGYELTYSEPAGGHEPATWRGTMGKALALMLAR